MRTASDLYAPTPVPGSISAAGCWTGALVSDAGASTPFAFRQPSLRAAAPGHPSISLAGDPAHPARLLESAARSFVALVETAPDRLLLEARIRGDELVGRWLRRNADGDVIERGDIAAHRGNAA